MTRYSYRLYGQEIHSTHPLPALEPRAGDVLHDPEPVEFRFVDSAAEFPVPIPEDRSPDFTRRSIDPARPPLFHMWRAAGYLLFHFPLGHRIALKQDGRELWAALYGDQSSMDHLLSHAAGSMLGAVLFLRGALPLHAAVLEEGGTALAILGNSGSGKSTTALALSRVGMRVFSDDIAALRPVDGVWKAFPGQTELKLWAPSVRWMGEEEDALPRLAPNDPTWDKRVFISAEADVRSADPLPLKSVYTLFPDESLSAPVFTPLSPATALARLDANCFGLPLLPREQRQARMAALASLLDQARMVEVRRPDDIDRLADLAAWIRRDFLTNGSQSEVSA